MNKIVAISANTSWYLYNFRCNTIKELVNRGYEVIAISPKDDYSIMLESIGAKYIPIDIDQGGTNPFLDLKTLWTFKSIFHSIELMWYLISLRRIIFMRH